MVTTSLVGHANELSDAKIFQQIFRSAVTAAHPEISAEQLSQVHFLPDQNVLKALRSGSIQNAMTNLAASDLPALAKQTAPDVNVPAAPSGKDVTIVVLPGVLAEFIDNRAFKEVFKKTSTFGTKFSDDVARAGTTDLVPSINKYIPGAPEADISTAKPLNEIISATEITVDGRQTRVILLGTQFGSLESLGDARERAAVFIRRLEKYLALEGPQKLAFVGYSRGTILGLEMLAQAKAQNRPWVNDVAAMISLSGVVSGSSLADQAYADKNSASNRAIEVFRSTVDSLELQTATMTTAERIELIIKNGKSLASAFIEGTWIMSKDSFSKKASKVAPPLRSLPDVDPTAPVQLFINMAKYLGLDQPITDYTRDYQDYNAHIQRGQFLVKQLLASIKELTTDARTDWWKANTLPNNLTYYAITAAMANPDADAEQLSMFNNPFCFGGKSYDDTNLLQNSTDYTNYAGVKLNDSQVSVAQAAFLPQTITALNPANAGLKTKFLGTAGAHHWGLALQEVNVMRSGQKNGFPREALLQALAKQVLLDMP